LGGGGHTDISITDASIYNVLQTILWIIAWQKKVNTILASFYGLFFRVFKLHMKISINKTKTELG
jgi:hypothetical protein